MRSGSMSEDAYINAKRFNVIGRLDVREYIRCTGNQLANSIAIWLSESGEFRRVEAVALGVLRKGKLFMETEFLSLAQALEGIHRVTRINILLPIKQFHHFSVD
jgi:hypothetical protein